MPVAFLVVSLVGVVFTLNAYRPRRRQSILVVPSFFAGWLTSELAVHHIVWQVIATAVFVAAGALEAWPGWLALAITLASWVGLAYLARGGLHARNVTDEALRAGLGEVLAPDPGDTAPATPRARHAIAWPFARPGVQVEQNLRYAPGAKHRHLLDVYRPREPVTDAPVLLQVHGGGWVSGDKRHQGRPLMFHLVEQGWICAAMNYRLSPRATFPDHLVDVKLALAWIRAHIEEYGGNPAFVAITGGSAGGHLSALAALTPGDPEYQPGFADADTSVQAAVPFYGIYEFSDRFGGRGADGMGSFIERVVLKRRIADDPDAFVRASPLRRIRADAPPFMVVHGSHDSLAPVAGARAFSEQLRAESRAPVVSLELPGAQHAFEVFHSPRTHHVVHAVHRFLDTIHAAHLAR
ncbi:MAG: alpha/beta hydrolase [Acidimicrobiia bacterium]